MRPIKPLICLISSPPSDSWRQRALLTATRWGSILSESDTRVGRAGAQMRFEKADKLLRLAMELQARRQGMTVEDVQAHLRISRSTALRTKGALEGVFQLEEAPAQDDRRKRWRIAP